MTIPTVGTVAARAQTLASCNGVEVVLFFHENDYEVWMGTGVYRDAASIEMINACVIGVGDTAAEAIAEARVILDALAVSAATATVERP